MSKFKVGDRVVCVSNESDQVAGVRHHVGDVGVVEEIYRSYVVFVKWDNGQNTAVYTSDLELEQPQETPGATKHDSGKPPISMIPRSALDAEAEVLAFGASKYGRNNWRQGMDYSRLVDAALRHLTAIADGEFRDPESGKYHAAHVRCCMGFLIEYMEKNLGNDDLSRVDG